MSQFASPLPSQERTLEGATSVEAASVPLALQMIPPAHPQKIDRDQVQLVSTMRSLVLDRRHPIALEIAGTHQQRCLLIRARNADDLSHVETQLHARLPHARFVPLTGRDDPFSLSAGETVSVLELHPGQASYLPLQPFDSRNQGEDPILGILGALDALPPDLRAIAQIALVPASPTWSRPYQRKALEHALEPERQQRGSTQNERGAPSTLVLMLGALFLAGSLLFRSSSALLPTWLPVIVQALLAGHWRQVWLGPYRLQAIALMGTLVVVLLIPLALQRLWKRLFQPPLYDMRSVATKTSRSAYHVRIRLYVIGPGTIPTQRWQRFLCTLSTLRSGGWRCLSASGSYALAGQWKQARRVFFAPFIRGSKNIWRDAHRPRQTIIRAWTRLARAGGRLWQHWQQARYHSSRRQQILARLLAAYRQYNIASGNYFVPRRVPVYRARRWIRKGTWWKGVHRSRQCLDVETLAVLWHAPADASLPDLARIAYRQGHSRLLPPGLEHAQNETPLGISEHAGHRIAFGLPLDCFESHMLIGGKSGEGKSTLMQHLILRSMLGNKGLIVIDPHGDLAEQVIGLVPAERADEVVFLDLSDPTFACGINPLDAMMAHSRDKIISDLIKIFSSLWTSWGSRMEIAFEYSLRTLYEANKRLCQQGKAEHQYTLLDIMALLTDESFCHALLEEIEDPFIRRWWRTYYDPLSLQMQRDRVDPVLSKVAKFEGTIARHIVGQSRCSIDFADAIAQQRIILIKLAKGVIGEDVARILGATLLGFLTVALEEQGNLEDRHRKHLPIFIDEFQTLDGVDWGALAELRKYGATFFLATQSLEYLREKHVLPVVLANVKQLAIFRMSAEDARILHRELDVDPEDIVHQEPLTCYLKLLSGRQQHPTFSCTLRFPPTGEKEHAQRIREQCQRRLMRPVTEIEAEIIARLARQIGASPTEPGSRLKEIRNDLQSGGRARENGGYRGRKSQEKAQRSVQSRAASEETTRTGEITIMNWEETVGSSSEANTEGEHDEDPGD